MYELSSSSFLYELLYTTYDIISANPDNVYAEEVSVSGDGMVFGFTSTSVGTKIFERIGDGFQQRGAVISGYGDGIALNYDGSIVIVGDRNWPSNTGRASVFQWKNDNEDGSMQWMQMGSDITGDATDDYLGWYGCVSFTYDGLTIAVGSYGYDRDGLRSRGLVRVYNYDSTSDTWQQSGIDLVGDNAYDQFSRTSLSSDGAYLAVGASDSFVRLFAKNGDNYVAVRDTIIGEGYRFAWSVDISADASALVVGDFSFDGNKGKVYLYDTFSSSPTSTPTTSPSTSPTRAPQSSSMASMNPTASNAQFSLICMLLLWMFL